MFKVLYKKELSPGIFDMDIEAPRVAKKAKAGQFIVLRVDDTGERVPLTIADNDPETGAIKLIFQVMGASTMQLASKNPGESIADFTGPLGTPSHVEPGMGTIVMVGGGIGVAPCYPIARAMHNAGNKVIGVLAAKSKDILIFEDRMAKVCDEIVICTDDGSKGIKGFANNAVTMLHDRGEKIDQVTAIGPAIMMKSICDTTRPLGIHTVVSLNPIMVDGTGMCGGCRVQIGNETKFACVDGPEFDGHLVDFKSLMSRSRMYRDEEQVAKDHICHIGLGR